MKRSTITVFYDNEGRIKWPTLLLTAGVSLILIGFLWMGIDKLSMRRLEQSIGTSFVTADQVAQRVELTRDKWRNNHLLFADQWSLGLDDQIAEAERNTGPDGAVADIQSAQDALAQGKRGEAGQHLTLAEEKMSQATEIADYVLGSENGWTTGLYDRLHTNTSLADSTLNAAQTCITTTWGAITAYEDSDNYADGVNDLVQAQSNLDLARAANVTVIERGLIDKPLVYDYAVASKSDCDQALADAMPTPPTAVPNTPVPETAEDETENTETTTSPVIPSNDWWTSNPVESSPSTTETYTQPEPVFESPSFEVPDTTSWDEPELEVPSDNTAWDNEEW